MKYQAYKGTFLIPVCLVRSLMKYCLHSSLSALCRVRKKENLVTRTGYESNICKPISPTTIKGSLVYSCLYIERKPKNCMEVKKLRARNGGKFKESIASRSTRAKYSIISVTGSIFNLLSKTVYYTLAWVLVNLFVGTLAFGQITPKFESFNSGELSPMMLRRSGFAKYQNGAKELENMLILSQGPTMRRPGTKYIAEVKTSADEAHLIPFEFSKSDAYVLEFGDLYFRVYRNGGVVLDGASPDETVTVFSDHQLSGLQHVQRANDMYIVDANHPPQKVTRADHDDWTIADVDFQTGPFLAENETTTFTIASSGTTGTVTLTASGGTPFNDPCHVGSLWRINHRVVSASFSGSFAGDGSSSTLPVGGAWDASTKGTWTGTVTVERSDDAGSTWEQASGASVSSVNDDNMDHSATETEPGIIYRMTMSNHSSGTATYNFSAQEYIHIGIVKITAVASSTSATATVLTDLASTDATFRWSEGSWSDFRGWPQTIETYEQRMFYGGSESYPQTVWATKTASGADDDYENMLEGVDDDDALIYILPGQNPIQWMNAQTYLLVGTLSGVGRWGSSDDATAITPTQPTSFRLQAQHGAKFLQAVLVGDAVLYVERGGDRVREFVYTLERDRFIAPDLTVLSEHITGDGIIDIAYQSRPDSVLWCVLADGDIATLTYQREQEVVGWTRHTTEGSYESITVIPGVDEDEVWVVVNRTVNSSTVRYVEQFQPVDWGSDQADMFFVDSGLTFDGGDAVNITGATEADPIVVTVDVYPTDGAGDNLADGDQIKIVDVLGMTELNDNIYTISNPNVGNKTMELRDSTDVVDINSVDFTTWTSAGTVQRFERDFTNLTHLALKTVAILGDGQSLGQETVNVSGEFSTDVWANKLLAGLPYTSQVETMPIVLQGDSGTTSGKKARIVSIAVDFFDSLGVRFGSSADNADDIVFASTDDDVDNPPALFTGWKIQPFLRGFSRDITVYLEQSEPLPMLIRAIVPKVEIVER